MTDSPLQALRLCIANLNEREASKERPKRITLASVPRALALRIVGDYAAEKQVALEPGHMAALCDKAKPELLLVIDGLPVVAGPMLAPMFCLWTWPADQALREVEEHPLYPALPWYPGLEEKEPVEMVRWINQASRQATKMIEMRTAKYTEPATLYMPEGWQDETYDDGIKVDKLADDPAIALEQFKDSLEERRPDILAGLNSPTGFGLGIRGSDDFISQVREFLGREFDCHTEQAEGEGLTVIHLSKRSVTLN